MSVGSVWKLCCCSGRKEQEPISEDDVKYIFTEFNAWTYNGSDNLWASFMETLWTDIESHFGRDAVRRHRASIALSSEEDSDDIETKTRKRDEALFRYYATTIFAFLITVAGVGLGVFLLAYFGKCAIEDGDPVPECRYEPLGDLNANFTDSDGESAFVLGESADISRKVFGILTVTISPLPFFKKLHTFIRDVLPAYISSPKQVLQGALLGEGYNRNDFSAETGFMGIVKTEAEYLFDFVRTHGWYDDEQEKFRTVRMCICVDDLDRCDSQTTVFVLEAMFLLLSDSPISCYLAIDTRLVVASIDEHRLVHDRAGVNGYDFLEKLVQLEFCIPDLTNTKKQEYMNLLFYEGLLEPLKILGFINELIDYRGGNTSIKKYFKDVKANDMDTRDAVEALDIIRKGMKKARDDALDTPVFANRDGNADVLDKDLEDRFKRLEKDYVSNVYFRPLESFLAEKTFSKSEHQEKNMCKVLDYLRNQQEDLRNYGRVDSPVERLMRIISKLKERGNSDSKHHFEDVEISNDEHLNFQNILKGMKKARDESTRTSSHRFDFSPVEHFFEPYHESAFINAAKNKIIWTLLDYLGNEQKDWISSESGQHEPVHTANGGSAQVGDPLRGDRVPVELITEVDGPIQPMVTGEEWQWFDDFVKYFVGKPRSIRRVVNVYNAARHVSEMDGGHKGNPTFRKKLLKMLILAEFWPYRTSWLLQIIADAGQHAEIDELTSPSDKLGSTESVVPNVFVLLKKVMKHESSQTNHEFFEKKSLLDLYKKVIEALLHSPKDANRMLSRDYDPQLFEMLLGETSAGTNVASLTMSDLLLPDQCRPTNEVDSLLSVRPFLFNMPQHMTEYTSSCIDDLVLFYEGDPGQVLLRYEYKKETITIATSYRSLQVQAVRWKDGIKWMKIINSCYHHQATTKVIIILLHQILKMIRSLIRRKLCRRRKKHIGMKLILF